jgi:hypothetical protein
MKALLLAALVFISFPALAAEKPVACPMIAKLCPDGSSVSPQGPKCIMPACPNGGDAQSQSPSDDGCTDDDCDAPPKKTDTEND